MGLSVIAYSLAAGAVGTLLFMGCALRSWVKFKRGLESE